VYRLSKSPSYRPQDADLVCCGVDEKLCGDEVDLIMFKIKEGEECKEYRVGMSKQEKREMGGRKNES
jgi:hypothetical protein